MIPQVIEVFDEMKAEAPLLKRQGLRQLICSVQGEEIVNESIKEVAIRRAEL